jgi:DNA-binding NarL/FixJ family response regulator
MYQMTAAISGVYDAVEWESAMTYKVVVADDAPGLRELLSLVLEMDGDFRVVDQASDGAEAIEKVAKHRPDLLVMDVTMPYMTGLEALPHVRPHVKKVVILSSYDAGTMADDALAAGADAYMTKGVMPDELVQALLHVLQDDGACNSCDLSTPNCVKVACTCG